MISTSPRALAPVVGLILLSSGALAACSSGSSKSGAAAATPSASASPSGSDARGSRAGLFSNPKVEQCLSAAGISIPSRTPGARPTYTGPRPSGSPRPSYSGTRPPGGQFFGGAEGAKIQQALKACGITLPTDGARAAMPSPTGSAPPA